MWAKRQLLEPDTWASTSSKMLENQDIREQVSTFLVNELYSSVDVQAEIAKPLPPKAKPLAGPAAGGLKQLANKAANEGLQQPRVQALWENANRVALTELLAVVEDKSGTVSNQSGEVTLDLRKLVAQLATATGLPNVSDKIPPDKAQIVILRSDQLGAAQDAVNLLKTLAWVLTALALALFALGVYLAKGWRREALRAVGFSFIAVGIVVLVARSLAGTAVVDSLATTSAVEPAASAAWSIGTSVLKAIAGSMIFYGVLIVIAAWLAGNTRPAVWFRREIAAFFREPQIAYVSLAIFVALLLWWAPTDGLKRPLPALILIGFLILGTEVLRRQVAREFPDETQGQAAERWRGRMSGVGDQFDRARSGTRGAGGDDQLARLERLGALKKDGTITDEEFEAQKAAILGSS